MPTSSSTSEPSGAADGDPNVPPTGREHGDDSGTSTALEDPDLPYAGFTWAEGGIILGASILVTAIMVVSMLTGPPCCGPSTQREVLLTTFNRGGYYLLWALCTVPIFWACVRLRPRNVGWGAALAGHSALAFLISFGVRLGREGIVYGLVNAWPPEGGGEPSFSLPLEILANFEFLEELVPYLALLIIGLVRAGYLRGQARREQAEQLEREAEQLRSRLTAARLESLRMQLNPHFFHNTLHTISTMAGRDPDGIRKATARLSDLMRHVLSTSDQQEVPLEEELDVLESYLDIQKLRLDHRLEVTMDVDPVARRALVPTLLLQPLAENAVKHGFEGRDETGRLAIRARREANTLVLEVSDDGSGLPDDGSVAVGDGDTSALRTGDGSLGLENIAERLENLYGDAAALDFEPSDEGGLRVVVRLPFRTSDPESDLRASGVVAE